MVTAEFKAPDRGSIQIVHIAGKRQGEIDHFLPGSISFGRSPDCDVVFPRDALTVSRIHAKIQCYDGSCQLTNMSGNGCYVNGKLRDTALLAPGDVITFSENGPKVSFLYEPPQRPETALGLNPISPISAQAGRVASLYGNSVNQLDDDDAGEFTLYFGRKLKSFYQRSVTVGRSDTCDFVIDHPRMLDRHIQVYFDNNQYYLHNSTELKLTRLNGDVLHNDAVLKPNDTIDLTKFGPTLIYKGEGKFQEKLKLQDSGEHLPRTVQSAPAPLRTMTQPKFLRRLIHKLFH